MAAEALRKEAGIIVKKLPKARRNHLKLVKRLHELDDGTLIKAYIAGNEQAFTLLYERYQMKVINFINTRIRDRSRAEDLSQETFMRVHRHIKKYDVSKKFSTWIFTIASNLSKNELRNRSRELVVFQNGAPFDEFEGQVASVEDTKSMPDKLYGERHLCEATDRAVSKMPLHQRKVFILREFNGLHYGEIQAIVDVKLGTIKSRLHRARDIFKREMSLYKN